MFNRWFNLLRNLVIGVNAVAINLAPLTAEIAALKTVVAGLPAALGGNDSANQALVDQAVSDLTAVVASLNALVTPSSA